MAGVGGGRGVAVAYGVGESGEADYTRITTVADALEFAVPVSGGKPDFETDIGIRRRLYRSGHAAEGWKILYRLRARRREGAGRPGFGDRYDSVPRRGRGQAFASRAVAGHRDGQGHGNCQND